MKTGKEARPFTEDGMVEPDRSALDRMDGLLEHTIRNTVAHSIESVDERCAKGKTPADELTFGV